jgi:tRNA (guanine37-N1)-methyltransferase
VVLLSPQGRLFHQGVAEELARYARLVLVCGRYEGVDERVSRHFVDEELSLGDYILTGGELAAMVVVDAVTRLLPGVLGNAASAETESFAEPILEFPQYTRPQEFRGHAVPGILLSGNHLAIRRWRRGQALLRTRARRPDLFARLHLSAEDDDLLAEAYEESTRITAGSGIARDDRNCFALYGSGTLPGGESSP